METTTPLNLTIRPATEADIACILTFRAGMFRDLHEGDEDAIGAILPIFAEWLQAQMTIPDRIVTFLGEIDGTPVACATVWTHDWYPTTIHDPHRRRGYVFNVYTLPDYRRQGIAGQLVQACVDWLRERGIRKVSLHASPFGQSVYARLGFQTGSFPEMALTIVRDR